MRTSEPRETSASVIIATAGARIQVSLAGRAPVGGRRLRGRRAAEWVGEAMTSDGSGYG